MAQTSDFESRLSAVEERAEVAAADASAARHLAAAHDRDLADLPVKVDANRAAINALGLQTAARFDEVDRRFERLERKVDGGFARVDARFAEMDARFERVDAGFAEMRARLDQTAAGRQTIVDLLTVLIDREAG